MGLAALLAGPSLPLAFPVACWLLASRLRGFGELLLLLLAPVSLSAAVPLKAPLGADLAVAFAAVSLSIVPLARGLGPGWPSARVGLVLAGAFVTPLLFFLSSPGAVVSASDLATGALILSLAAGVGFASLVLPREDRPQRQKPNLDTPP